MKKIVNIFTTLIMLFLILIVCIFFVPRLFGTTPMVVLSGSMEPTYPVGGLIFVEKTNPETIKIGDNVTFYMGNTKTVVTHRIVSIDEKTKTFQTKGDSNNNIDGNKLPYSNILGKAKDFAIPYLGFLAAFVNSTIGKIIVIGLVIIVILLSILFGKSEDKKKGKVEQDSEDK